MLQSMKMRLAVLAVVCAVAAVYPSLAAAVIRDARVGGTFIMSGVVTSAVNVRGERPGELVNRKWEVQARDCDHSVCGRLLVTRNRGSIKGSFVILRRVGVGHYRGSGDFWAPLQCLGRLHALGSFVPYTIQLYVFRRKAINGIRYATGVNASYISRSRTDNTRCPLGPASDSARYSGRLISPLPKAEPQA
jgi:hypothetical protein